MSLAEDLWKAEAAVSIVEEKVVELLDAVFGPDDGWASFDTDATDESIEIYGVGEDEEDLTDDEQKKFKEAGFKLVWTHAGEKRRSSGEKCYEVHSVT